MVEKITIRNAKKVAEILTAVVLAYGAMMMPMKTRTALIVFNNDGWVVEEILQDAGINVISRKALV